MCRRLGKKHSEYFDRNDALYEIGPDGVKRMYRTYAGHRIVEHHGANVLDAYTGLRDKVWSQFPDQWHDGQKITPAKQRKLDRLQRCCNHGMGRYGRKRRAHLERNHVTVI